MAFVESQTVRLSDRFRWTTIRSLITYSLNWRVFLLSSPWQWESVVSFTLTPSHWRVCASTITSSTDLPSLCSISFGYASFHYCNYTLLKSNRLTADAISIFLPFRPFHLTRRCSAWLTGSCWKVHYGRSLSIRSASTLVVHNGLHVVWRRPRNGENAKNGGPLSLQKHPDHEECAFASFYE